MASERDTMIFCTCAEKNCDFYLERVRRWYEMFSPLHGEADFYCAVDGTIRHKSSMNLPEEIILMEFPHALGRRNTLCFPGWKRSYGGMLKFCDCVGYKYLAHIENDVVVRNFDKLMDYLHKPGLYSSWCAKYNFPEGAFQILNDLEARKKLAERYTKPEGFNETCLFEDVLKQYSFEFPFASCRIEGGAEPELIEAADFTAQSYDKDFDKWK